MKKNSVKIGFFGGCFNPPTKAHINLAQKALKECDLNKVIFVPVGDFYDKEQLVSGKHRYNMLSISCKDLENIEVTDLELNIKQKLYASDAFKLIEKNYKDVDIFFIMGADNFINIINWKNGNEIINRYRYIVFEREKVDLKDYIEKDLENYKDRIFIIKNDTYNKYSSSKFRNMAKQKDIYDKEIVSDKVLDYIIENKLYIIY